ncbi:hypothetical protein [Pseudonocardia sp. TRM90224]|uniref:hypothetical protein n=1 Tax=Pseudonocardia sp. TRM90224 TaxID=2812678 RepID=UPI001E4C8D77|nr:hypothetical protein [Pseudonocardia sp. TRM90224]
MRRWPVYVISTLLPIQVLLYAVTNDALAQLATGSDGGPDMLRIMTYVAQDIGLATQGWVLILLIPTLRHPPRVTPAGLRLWLHTTSEQVTVPWERVTVIRKGSTGIAFGGLFVHVHDPDALAGGNTAALRRIRRSMRRFGGAPFACGISTTPRRLLELDAAIRHFSGGRHALRRI